MLGYDHLLTIVLNANAEDIKLLFYVLQNLREFKSSNLVAKKKRACARAGAIDFGDTESSWHIEKLKSDSMKGQAQYFNRFFMCKGFPARRQAQESCCDHSCPQSGI